MLVLLCVQVVQTNNNEFNWREKKNIFLLQTKDMWACQIAKYLNLKSSIDKIHKELNFNIDSHIKTYKNHNLLQV
jgi:hypothetical protein